MLRGTQFDIAFFLFAILVAAVLLAYGQIWPVAFLVGLIVAIYVGGEYLSRNLPENVVRLQSTNCVRANGTRSLHRESVEKREFHDLKTNIRLILLIGIAPWILLIWHDSFDTDYLLIGCLAWIIVSFLILRHGYLYFVRRFVFDLKRRAQQYKIRDLDQFIREEEMVADRNRERFEGMIEDSSPNPVVISPKPK